MKLHLLVAASLLVAAATPSADLAAQQVVPFLGGGLAIGTGDLGSDTNNGWLVIGGVDVPLPSIAPGFAVGATAIYSRIPYAGQFSEATQVTSISGELSYLIGDAVRMVRPFVRGGGGVQIHRYEPGNINTNATTDAVAAFSAGAGINIAAGPGDVVLGARFASGLDAGFLGLHGGFSIPVGSIR